MCETVLHIHEVTPRGYRERNDIYRMGMIVHQEHICGYNTAHHVHVLSGQIKRMILN